LLLSPHDNDAQRGQEGKIIFHSPVVRWRRRSCMAGWIGQLVSEEDAIFFIFVGDLPTPKLMMRRSSSSSSLMRLGWNVIIQYCNKKGDRWCPALTKKRAAFALQPPLHNTLDDGGPWYLRTVPKLHPNDNKCIGRFVGNPSSAPSLCTFNSYVGWCRILRELDYYIQETMYYCTVPSPTTIMTLTHSLYYLSLYYHTQI